MSEDRRRTDPPDLVGEQIGRYLLQRKIGSGGVATVYQAYDHVDGRSVALKVLLPTADANTISRFRREALTAGGLKHPNIVRIYQVGTALEGDIGYIAMELVEGESLADWVGRAGRLRPEESCNLLEPIALALAEAHDAGIVHRDVKPSNILLQPASPGAASSVQLESLDHPVIPLLTDFGVARSLDAPDLTNVGRTVGTPAYMAPEQASGTRSIDGRADIYALGTVLYRAVVGHLPFSGTTTQILHAHVYAPLTIDDDILRQLPPIVVDIMRRSLAKAPEDRYPDAVAMADDLALAAGRQRALLPVGSSQPSDATATLTLSTVQATSRTSSTRSARIIVPVDGPFEDVPPSGETAEANRLPSPGPSQASLPRPESLTMLQRLERLNWIGYGLALLALMAIAIGVTLATLSFSSRLGDPNRDVGLPPTNSLAVVQQRGDGPAALAFALPTVRPLPSPSPETRKAEAATLLPATALPTQTPLPSATPTTPVPTDTPVPTETPTPAPTAPPIASAPPTVAPEAIFTCPNLTEPFFATYIAGMGEATEGMFRCPNGGAVRTTGQLLRFEHGFMMDLKNSPSIYIYYDSNQEWERAVSTWQEGDPARFGELTPPAPNLFQPEDEFGQLWADPQRQVALGFATVEKPVPFAAVEQTFPGGALVGDEESGAMWLFLRETLRL